MAKTIFLVVRHGQTDWNREGRLMGISDIPLNAAGRLQAGRTARYLSSYPVDAIVSSPLTRAVETAKIIHTGRKKTRFETDPNLMERSFGILEGMKYEEANARYPQIVLGSMWQYPDFRPPEGESLSDVSRRAKSVIDALAETYSGKTVLVVSHGSFIRNFFSVLLSVPLGDINGYGFTNASVSIASYQNGLGEAHVLNRSTDSG